MGSRVTKPVARRQLPHHGGQALRIVGGERPECQLDLGAVVVEAARGRRGVEAQLEQHVAADPRVVVPERVRVAGNPGRSSGLMASTSSSSRPDASTSQRVSSGPMSARLGRPARDTRCTHCANDKARSLHVHRHRDPPHLVLVARQVVHEHAESRCPARRSTPRPGAGGRDRRWQQRRRPRGRGPGSRSSRRRCRPARSGAQPRYAPTTAPAGARTLARCGAWSPRRARSAAGVPADGQANTITTASRPRKCWNCAAWAAARSKSVLAPCT